MKNKREYIKIIFLLNLSFFILINGFCEEKFNINFRPWGNKYLYDYTGVLKDVEESSSRYLENIRKMYSIEAIIVSVSSLEGEERIEDLAVKIFNNWKVGKDYGGRGVLLLFVDDNKLVKLEVAYEVEDVFTDAFCGYIEDLQLRPYFLSGQLGIGLLAVMEEIEERAQIKHQGDYSLQYIEKLDRELLSGGAGAKRSLLEFPKERIEKIGDKYPAGETPKQSWQTLIQSWRDKVRDADLGVYTEVTKLIYRDYQNLPNSRYEKDVQTYADKPYEVIQNQNYAVIFFGNKQGWDNAPFLLCKTEEGWKFDIVHQRKYIRMGASPYWGIERANYPYIDLLSRCPYWMSQDIPLAYEDSYRLEDDVKLAEEIKRLEEEYNKNPNDFNNVMELCRLYTIVSMGQKTIPLLNKAKQLNPRSALPYKYLAIGHVDSNFQYKTALEELKEYVKREPNDVFGYNFLGYLYFCLEGYPQAIDAFNKAVQLQKDNCYAFCKLSRAYGELYLKANALDPRRNSYKNSAREMFNKAQTVPSPDKRRLGWLVSWLREKRIMD